MKRKLFLGLTGVVVLALAAFFIFAPGVVERGMNQVDGEPLIEVSDEAKALHATLAIVDLHSDTLLWKRDLLERAGRGHVDLPRLREGNVALQVFSSVTKTPKDQNYDANGADSDNITLLTIAQLQPMRTWNSLLERSLWHAQKLETAIEEGRGELYQIWTPDDVRRLMLAREGKGGPRPVGALFSAEGLQSLEGDPDNLDTLYDAGMRMAGLTHFFDNKLAGSMHGLGKGGLTPMGREVIGRMERMGMIVDIAHCSHQCVADVLAMAKRPVVSSHGGVQATCKVNRNLTDAELRGVAKTGGVVGIGYWDGAVCDTSPRSAAQAMKHVRDLVGIEHVALGSDYDGATTVRFDTAHLLQVTQALLDEGFTPDEIRATMGGNALRVIRAGLVPLESAE
ncbi:dipeptidase [Qipengyuania sp. SS22]|uniref:dipeptidase n=1 Tax=Qipengyuania sp. SS22 TaxID=2979461 RepID=UPI0021E5F828|nr:dipeptidase [Qipengyuania sp. SS22]UYH54474.1 dipeptidase [Qipengyuania sp. SS22]